MTLVGFDTSMFKIPGIGPTRACAVIRQCMNDYSQDVWRQLNAFGRVRFCVASVSACLCVCMRRVLVAVNACLQLQRIVAKLKAKSASRRPAVCHHMCCRVCGRGCALSMTPCVSVRDRVMHVWCARCGNV